MCSDILTSAATAIQLLCKDAPLDGLSIIRRQLFLLFQVSIRVFRLLWELFLLIHSQILVFQLLPELFLLVRVPVGLFPVVVFQ